MNLPAPSIDSLIRDIIEVMTAFGRNRSEYEFDLAHHHKKWWVTIELNTQRRTIDFETSHTDAISALVEALSKVRREASICGAIQRAA